VKHCTYQQWYAKFCDFEIVTSHRGLNVMYLHLFTEVIQWRLQVTNLE